MSKIIASFILVCVLTTGCNNASHTDHRKDGFSDALKTREDSLFHDVLEGHDVGMAKMGKIRKAIDGVQSFADSLGKLTGKQKNDSLLAKAQTIKQELVAADQGMNTWMETFTPDSGKGNESIRLKYLESEKEKVGKVKEAILNSLQRADSLLGKGKQ